MRARAGGRRLAQGACVRAAGAGLGRARSPARGAARTDGEDGLAAFDDEHASAEIGPRLQLRPLGLNRRRLLRGGRFHGPRTTWGLGRIGLLAEIAAGGTVVLPILRASGTPVLERQRRTRRLGLRTPCRSRAPPRIDLFRVPIRGDRRHPQSHAHLARLFCAIFVNLDFALVSNHAGVGCLLRGLRG